MADEGGGTQVTIALHPIKDLLDVAIDQLSKAVPTDEVQRALNELRAVQTKFNDVRCPEMYFKVTFK
jgi:hypothetical protein